MKKLSALIKKIDVFEKLASEVGTRKNFLRKISQDASGLADTSGAKSAARQLTKAIQQFFSKPELANQLPSNIRSAANNIRALSEQEGSLSQEQLSSLLQLAKSMNYVPSFPASQDPAGVKAQWDGLVLSNVRALLSAVGSSLNVTQDTTVTERPTETVTQPAKPAAQKAFPKPLQSKLNQIVSVEGLGAPITVNGLWTKETARALNQFKAKHAPDALGFQDTIEVLRNYHPGYNAPAVDPSKLASNNLKKKVTNAQNQSTILSIDNDYIESILKDVERKNPGVLNQLNTLMNIRLFVSPNGQLLKGKITFDQDGHTPENDDSKEFDRCIESIKRELLNKKILCENGEQVQATNNLNNIQIDYTVEDVIG